MSIVAKRLTGNEMAVLRRAGEQEIGKEWGAEGSFRPVRSQQIGQVALEQYQDVV